jgi:tetratricopeptide (TPR) repeat protein
MAFNKNKSLESALKYLNQGKVSQAISEYQQILRHDAKDQATLMTVGDLFARQGDLAQATEYFERLAQVYLNEGFNSKAIAIYKKIAKLAPNELTPLERLADLYVQQGVLSEARPLFLQIAEAHLKANAAPKAVEVLHRLLIVEPDNPRVQMRLAELYNVMGQKKEASRTYFAYAQRLFDRGDHEEAQKLSERALEVDPENTAAQLLKAKALANTNKVDQAIDILRSHPEADAGGEVTNLVVDLKLKSGQIEKAAERARTQLARGSANYALLHRVAESLIEGGHAAKALPLLQELRGPMIEVGEQDKFMRLLAKIVEKLPGETEPLEMLADFCRHTSDPFPLNTALSQLVDIYSGAGNYDRAAQVMEELTERNRGDERLMARLNEMRARRDGTPLPETATPSETQAHDGGSEIGARQPQDAAPASVAFVEETLSEATQRYVAQALTDADLFSSYGLTHKATNLLEAVLRRVPRHTATLERLLDLYLGGGNDRRTAELAAVLEQIYREHGDTINTERFAELRQRYQKTVGATVEELLQQSSAPAEPEAPLPRIESASAGAIPVNEQPVEAAPPEELTEFEISLEPGEAESSEAGSAIPAAAEETRPSPEPAIVSGSELDLSDEWEAISQDVAEPGGARPEGAEPEGTQPAAAAADTAANGDFVLELPAEAVTTEEFLSELANEVEDMQTPAAKADASAREIPPAASGAREAALAKSAASRAASERDAENVNELSEIFQEFRNELGEVNEEEEDLETHYNLGIAYREMGLLDEAIGEFQKVANLVRAGKPFRYAMNCATLLALSFAEKGDPKIAAIWYQRALETPGLDAETILALRYDLAVSLAMAGDSSSALDSFRQVYAMNIDYRDVADRIAILQKQ